MKPVTCNVCGAELDAVRLKAGWSKSTGPLCALHDKLWAQHEMSTGQGDYIEFGRWAKTMNKTSLPLLRGIPETLGRGGGGHGDGGHGGGGHGGGWHGGGHGGGWHGGGGGHGGGGHGGGRWGGRGWGGRGRWGRGWGWGWPGYATGWGGWGWGWDWPYLYATGPAFDTCAYNAPQAAVYLEENYGSSPWWRGVKVENMRDGSQVLHVAVSDRAAGNLLPTSICSYPVVASVAAPMGPSGVAGVGDVEFGPARGSHAAHREGLRNGQRYGLVLRADGPVSRKQIEEVLEAHGFHPELVSASQPDNRADWSWASADPTAKRLYAVGRWEGPDSHSLMRTRLPEFAHVFAYDTELGVVGDSNLTPEAQCEMQGGSWNGTACIPDASIKDAMKAQCEASGGTWDGKGCVKMKGSGPDELEAMAKVIEACQQDLASSGQCEKLRAVCLDPAAQNEPDYAELCKGALAPDAPKKSVMPYVIAGGIGLVAIGLVVATLNMKPGRPATA